MKLTCKICILGSFAVGKTSLVKRFVTGTFDERYLTTIGVKIDKYTYESVDGHIVEMVIWDMEGRDVFNELRADYLRGAAGCLLVADGTRPDTLAVAEELRADIRRHIGDVPLRLLLNKSDRVKDWRVDDDEAARLESSGWTLMRSSALNGEGVEEAFASLANAILQERLN